MKCYIINYAVAKMLQDLPTLQKDLTFLYKKNDEEKNNNYIVNIVNETVTDEPIQTWI